MEGLDTEKESLSSKVRRRFGWKRKIIHEKEREDGSGEVMIELPAKHEGMIHNSSGDVEFEKSEKEIIGEQTKGIEIKNKLDDCYIEVMTTLTTLFTPNYDETVRKEDIEKVMFENNLKCQNSNKLLDDTEKLCDITVLHVPKVVSKPSAATPSYSWLSTQSVCVVTALRGEIMDFEKEYNDVQEIVKKDHIEKSIGILLESSKLY